MDCLDDDVVGDSSGDEDSDGVEEYPLQDDVEDDGVEQYPLEDDVDLTADTGACVDWEDGGYYNCWKHRQINISLQFGMNPILLLKLIPTLIRITTSQCG